MNLLINSFIDMIGKLGGFAVVVCGICKISVDYFMKKKTSQYEKEIEKLKYELSTEIEKSKILNEQVLHNNKLLFDEEVAIYKKISPYINDVKDSITLYIVNIHNVKVDQQKEKECMFDAKKKLDRLREEWTYNSLFMDEKVYSSLEVYLKECFNALNKAAQKESPDYDVRSEIEMVINHYGVLKDVIRKSLIKKTELI